MIMGWNLGIKFGVLYWKKGKYIKEVEENEYKYLWSYILRFFDGWGNVLFITDETKLLC